MAEKLMDLTDFYVSSCPTCYVIFGVTKSHEKRLRENHKSLYCPSGHIQSFKTPTDLEKAAQEITELHSVLAQTERELLALKKKRRKR